MNTTNSYALIELMHIQLELNNSRTQHFRHFVDQFYCYKHGYINKSGKANWDSILWKDYVSKAAKKTKEKSAVTKEHVFPLILITKKLQDQAIESPISLRQIESTIDQFLIFATITKEEDAKLRSLRLTKSMPNEYFNKKSDLYEDIFARYKIAKIDLFDSAELKDNSAPSAFTPLVRVSKRLSL